MSKQKLVIVFLYLLFLLDTTAQNNSDQLLKVVPPSPTVASLGKYGDVPVSLYTGIPNISIPLYEIKDGRLELPISLSYHAGGVKLEEIASPVGLSWTLNAGGVIGKNVRGLPDDFGPWQPQPRNNSVVGIMESGNSDRIRQLVKDVDKGDRDGEADLYYYNFNQFSGKFFYDQSGIIHTVPSKKLLIKPFENGWRITAEDGTVYTFNNVEEVKSASCSGDQSNTSAWFLTSIKSADGKREITFLYDKVSYTYETLIGQTKYFSINSTGNLCLSNPSPCRGTQHYNTHRLVKINFDEGYINFNYNKQRCDLTEDKSLDEINVFSKTNQLIKGYKIGYSYFGNNSDGCNYYTKDLKRLKLVSITEHNGTLQKPPYTFRYNESVELPNRLSYAQDHWGYYNGKLNNNDLIASFTTTVFSGEKVSFPGADRKANPLTAQAGVLTSIKYPTGGETLFKYESNSVSNEEVEPQPEIVEKLITFGASNEPAYNLPVPYESDELIIPVGGAQVQLNVAGLSNVLWPGCDFVQCSIIKDNNPVPYTQIGDSWNGVTTTWPAGTYKVRLNSDCNSFAKADFHITISVQIAVTNQKADIRPVGGLRIKQIEDKPGNGNPSMIKNYRYHNEGDSAHSSGVLVNFPDYGYDLGVESTKRDEHGSPEGAPIYCAYRVRQSFSNYPLATTQGSYVGYRHVIVDLGENGESWYSYNVSSDTKGIFPFAPIENFDWSRGFLLHSKDFIRRKDALILAKETIHTPYSSNQHRIYGLKTGRNFYKIDNGEMRPNLQPSPEYAFYPTTTEFYTLSKTNERTYDQKDPSRFIETVAEFAYSQLHLQLIQSKTTTSKSDQARKEEIVTKRKYPFDYSFTSNPDGAEASAIKNLQDLHVADAVIEEYTTKQDRDTTDNKLYNQRVLAGSITTYKPDMPYPDQLFKLEIGSSLPLTTFDVGSVVKTNTFVKNLNSSVSNSYKSAVLFNSYDDHGNITTQQTNNDVFKSYIWGYNYQYPVAEVIGIDYKTLMANSNVNESVLQSFSTTDDHMRSELNKIRTAFPTAVINTYTYNPLVGISSHTDINSRTTYYEYDSFGRLSIVRDQDFYILKKYCYNYQGQPDNCQTSFGNTERSGIFTKNCNASEIGSQVKYSVQANTYFGATQVLADSLADADIALKGQVYANEKGTCTAATTTIYYSLTIRRLFYSTKCEPGYFPLPLFVIIPYGAFTSIYSQEEADRQAELAAQEKADINGICTDKSQR
ncbi:MAG: DUF5977 domain-containing protein [Chitinophagaceae bacterium]